MKDLIKNLKRLSVPGVLILHFSDRKIRIVNSSNIVSSLQRLLPELTGEERFEVLSQGIPDKALRSLMCYIHKVRLSQLGYNVVQCSVKKWWIDKTPEDVDGVYKWVVRLRNTYQSIIIGVFEKEEMQDFLGKYYPGGRISNVIISSNKATKGYYEVRS